MAPWWPSSGFLTRGKIAVFSDAQKDQVRVVAQLAADALGRARLLEAERRARQRTERLQQTMTALVASASLAEVTAAVFQHGLPPFGASAGRLALADQQQPGLLVTLNSVGLPESVLAGWQALPATAPSPSREAVAASAPVYLATLEDLAARYPDAHKVLSRSGHQAWVALPLRSGGRTLGVLTLAFPGPHPLDGPDQIILTALGTVVADALGRAIQHDRDHDLVMSVQRSLLPEALPECPGVRLGARYMPAETRYGIGGDWYDAVLLSGGRILLIVGDVAGHGLKAAITMGQMRSAARALAPTHGSAALLDALDHCGTCQGRRQPRYMTTPITRVPMLTRMHGRRLTAYKKIGFAFPVIGETPLSPGGEMAGPRPPLPAPTSAGPRKPGRMAPVSASQVRAWAKEHGIDVADRGRLRPGIWEQYHAAHPA